VERRTAEIDLEIVESLRALHRVPLPARKENSEEIERLLHKFADVMKISENTSLVEEDRGVSPEKNKEQGRFRSTSNDESFGPLDSRKEMTRLHSKHISGIIYGTQRLFHVPPSTRLCSLWEYCTPLNKKVLNINSKASVLTTLTNKITLLMNV
ncbi:hypothetical protein HAX54_011614, partial [Datura stramonium]|nr:hypothetical protein [Datura stramonium]